MIITIDGPTASGKSTVANLIACNLGIYYLNSGLLFRALGYLLMTHFGYDEQTIMHPRIQDITACLAPKRFMYTYDVVHGKASLSFDGVDVTPHLKTEMIDRASSCLGVQSSVRDALNALQRMLADDRDVVVDGRDSGSVVFPDATVKFFLTASPEVRAQRWRSAQRHLYSPQEALRIIKERDLRDSSRAVAPLIVPAGAIVVDTTELDQQETLAMMLECIQTKRASNA